MEKSLIKYFTGTFLAVILHPLHTIVLNSENRPLFSVRICFAIQNVIHILGKKLQRKKENEWNSINIHYLLFILIYQVRRYIDVPHAGFAYGINIWNILKKCMYPLNIEHIKI